jgi:hypothetical protein
MSTLTQVFNNGHVAQFDRNTSSIFIGGNRYDIRVYTNPSASPVTLVAGTVMGTVFLTGKILPLTSAATDGSQNPVGILKEGITVAGSATVSLYICIGGDVAEEMIVLQGADTLATVVSGKTLRDRLASDTLGIKIVRPADNLTAADNAIV